MGYAGGNDKYTSYDQVKLGITGHAEAVEVTYDPQTITTRKIMALFLKIHDPTTIDRQGNDEGPQYRSAIFYTTKEQKTAVEKAITDADKTVMGQQNYYGSETISKLHRSRTRTPKIFRKQSKWIYLSFPPCRLESARLKSVVVFVIK